jgi:large subunit ribosomal protein L20
MPRVKGGYTTRRRRKAVLKLAKGYYGAKHLLYRTAHEQVMRSLRYAYRDRKVRKREFRKLWIQRINAAAKLNGLKYNQFIFGLTNAGVEVNRKMLADLAVNDAAAFTQFAEIAKKNLTKTTTAVKENVVVLTKESKAQRALRAAQEAKSEKTVAPKKAAAPKAEAKVEAPKADLESLTVAELKAMAKEAGVKGISTMKKADLIAALTK